MKRLPPIEELKRLFDYDPQTGILRRKISTGRRTRAGDEAGSLKPIGYRQVGIAGNLFYVHRVCYAIYHGADPYPMQIDHINHDRSDNRIENLRLVSSQENAKNQKKNSNNTSGVAGVSWQKNRNKWIAQIIVNGKYKHLGCFTNKNDAIAARRAAEKKHGFHENHGDWEDQMPEQAPQMQMALFRPVAKRPQQELRA